MGASLYRRNPKRLGLAALIVSGVWSYASQLYAGEAASQVIEQHQAAWRAAIAHEPPPAGGCFTASYPLTVWRQVRCVKAPKRPQMPSRGGASPAGVTGYGNDYAAASNKLISVAVGSFPSVKHLKWEKGAGQTPNNYALQLNSNHISNDPACSGAHNPSKCYGWEQFVYASGGNAAYIQYWLGNYGNTCPPNWMVFGSDCYRNSDAVPVPLQIVSELPNLSLSGYAVTPGNDLLLLTTKTEAYSTSESDDLVFLANNWKNSEFNVFGNGDGSQAKFNVGASLTVKIELTDGTMKAPTCQIGAGTTAETSNLSLGPECLANGGASPSIKFRETQLGADFGVVYAFEVAHNGALPLAGLIFDGSGNSYGTTLVGGSSCCGAAFERSQYGLVTDNHSFSGGNDGNGPAASLIGDASGNLYGTTLGGGGSNCGGGGCGIVFRLKSNGLETVFHAFVGGNDGATPQGRLIADGAGNLYGTTFGGGNSGCGGNGCGTVFRISPNGTTTILYAFTGGDDGAEPKAGVLIDDNGNIYGTTSTGWSGGLGTVFKIVPDGTETTLHAFSGNGDGAYPIADLLADKAGNLYGTTAGGGSHNAGTVFKIATEGTETILYSFAGGTDGSYPSAGLIADKSGNLYGTTTFGGTYGVGTVFKLSANGAETVLHSFAGGDDGVEPMAALAADQYGNLYGTTEQGGGTGCNGIGCGTIFVIEK